MERDAGPNRILRAIILAVIGNLPLKITPLLLLLLFCFYCYDRLGSLVCSQLELILKHEWELGYLSRCSDGLRVGRPGFDSWHGRFFFSPQRLDRPFSLLSSGYCGDFRAVKQPGREANHSPTSRTEVKNGGNIPPHPHTSSWHSA
jgi:hypothetical protein